MGHDEGLGGENLNGTCMRMVEVNELKTQLVLESGCEGLSSHSEDQIISQCKMK